MFDWLKKILGIFTHNSSSESKDEEASESILASVYTRLDRKKKSIKQERENLKQTSVDWYSLIVPHNNNNKPSIKVYYLYCPEQLLNLTTLKEIRLGREAHELKVLEGEVKMLLEKIVNCVVQRKAEEAKQILEVVRGKISILNDSSIKKQYINLQNNLSKLMDELEQEKLTRLVEEQKYKEGKERKEAEGQRKRQEEVRQLAQESKKREQAEQQRLESLSTELKDNWLDFKQVLENNGIRYLYHFTDERNIPSIKQYGGLFSWYYCLNNGITIPCQGGDYDSRELDKKYKLEDYVRLSFCDDHPMAYRLGQSGSNIIILKIKVDVALLKHTLYSDINAADKLHTHGGCLKDLNKINFNATKRHYISRSDEDFKTHQAEVMVKTFIPLKYIVNI